VQGSMPMKTASIIIAHTPVYVWLILALLMFLGVRRLKPRRTHLALAALAPFRVLHVERPRRRLAIHRRS
jgi:hypothetical protein